MDDALTSTDACTLPTAERPLRLGEFYDLFVSSARAVTHTGAGVRIHLTGDAGLRERVRDLTARESECCSFFTFGIEGTDDDVVLEVSVPPERQQLLDALVARAEVHGSGRVSPR